MKIIIDYQRPKDLPTPEEIVQKCRDFDIEQAKAPFTHFPKRGFALESRDGTKVAWVKHGSDIAMSEAMTQGCVWNKFNGDSIGDVRVPVVYLAFEEGRYGYIVMELIQGVPCEDSDAKLVATTVQALVNFSIRHGKPGPVGRGLIRHPFFVEWKAPCDYSSVDHLQEHVNGILTYTKRDERVDFKPEVEAHGLLLCPADINKNNFLKDSSNKIVAIDFGCYSFLPPTFVELALRDGDDFAQRVRRHLQLPEATQLNALITAQRALVPYNSNDIGL